MIKYIRQPRSAIVIASILIPVGIGVLSQAMYTGNQVLIIVFMVVTGAGVGMGFGPLCMSPVFTKSQKASLFTEPPPCSLSSTLQST